MGTRVSPFREVGGQVGYERGLGQLQHALVHGDV